MQTDTPSPQSQDAAAVLLVNPLMCRPGSTRLPLSVLNLAAVLEGRRPWQTLDGNRGPITGAALAALGARPHAMVGVTVMPGPQVAPAIEISLDDFYNGLHPADQAATSAAFADVAIANVRSRPSTTSA